MRKFLEFIKLYWGYFMTVVAIGSFVWTLGVKAERKTFENINIKDDVKDLKVEQLKQKIIIDSLFVVVKDIKEQKKEILSTQNAILTSQNAMRNSYVKYLSNDKSLTKDEFIKYMNGLEFQLIPFDNVESGIEYNIQIVPIEK